MGISLIPRPDASRTEHAPRSLVLLVHGFNDPGWIWDDLVPALQDAGHAVGRFEYPDNDPIRESADLLAAELAEALRLGVERVDLVAHSMGSLVARDMLTRPELHATRGCRARLPRVGRLIMLGPPNHGSAMAHLADWNRVRDRIFGADRGGERSDEPVAAVVDLLPGSDFLRELNARSHPAHTEYTIVAGRLLRLSIEPMRAAVEQVATRMPRWARRWLDDPPRCAVEELVEEMVRGVGDGLVTIDSATLPGVEDLVIVDANHVDMIVNVMPGPESPKAVPIVLERLERGGAEGTEGRRD
jgi:pimeloyl-ACP methyl ester carboxylesterase